MEKIIKSERHQKALEYALSKINDSPLKQYIKSIYLYGSCARGEERFDSDVDLFVVLNSGYMENQSNNQKYLLKLKSEVFDDTYWNNPEVQLTTADQDWDNPTRRDGRFLFYKNIKRDGRLLWPN